MRPLAVVGRDAGAEAGLAAGATGGADTVASEGPAAGAGLVIEAIERAGLGFVTPVGGRCVEVARWDVDGAGGGDRTDSMPRGDVMGLEGAGGDCNGAFRCADACSASGSCFTFVPKSSAGPFCMGGWLAGRVVEDVADADGVAGVADRGAEGGGITPLGGPY